MEHSGTNGLVILGSLVNFYRFSLEPESLGGQHPDNY
jgi:hypothetical protein